MNQEFNNLNENNINPKVNSISDNQSPNNNSSNSIHTQPQQINPNIYQQNINCNPINKIYQQPIQQPVQNIEINNINNSKDNINKVKKFLLISLITIIIFVISLLIIRLLNNKNGCNQVNNGISVVDKIWQDYNTGKINADEYVKYMLYADYDNDLLADKYKSNNDVDLIEIESFIDKHYDELSDETLKYYLSKINLDNITFKLDKENGNNIVGGLDFFIESVYAKSENVTNLNKVILSKNGNFVVWYTTTGDSATDYESAKKVAEGLENTIDEYTKLFGYNYSYNSNVFSKGNTYKDQLKVLENSNIDTKYLESAMQIYLVNYTDSSLAKYVGRTAFLGRLWNTFKGGDEYGSVVSPYIIIKPSSFNDFERLEQLYNHELFHHYQYEVLCGHSECEVGSDPYILESTANWASSLVTKKTTNSGFLNEWAGTSRNFSNSLMSKSFEEKHGIGNVGYALFVYLNNYSNYVNDGTSNIIKSIYQDDALEYIKKTADRDSLMKIQENIAIKNLSQDYLNKNLIEDPNYHGKVPIESIISYTNESNNLNRIYRDIGISTTAIQYYKITDNSNYAFEINLTRDNYYIATFIIAQKDGKYTMVDKSVNDNTNHTFNTNDYGKYDCLYMAVANVLPNLDNYYSINFKNIKKETNSNNEKYASFSDCNGVFDECNAKIDTFYFDERGFAYKLVITQFFTDEDDIDLWLSNIKNNTDYTNIISKGKIIQYEYTDSWFEKNYGGTYTKDKLEYSYGMLCDLGCTGDSCKWGNSDGQIIDFNPQTIWGGN